jgi:hypothetical protein
MSEATERSRVLMFRITREIWDEVQIDLIDELIAEGLIDHVDLPGVEGSSGPPAARFQAGGDARRAVERGTSSGQSVNAGQV